jgi:hypothetical protein
MPHRSRVMNQTKKDTLVLQVIVTKVEQRKKLDGFNDDGESW